MSCTSLIYQQKLCFLWPAILPAKHFSYLYHQDFSLEVTVCIVLTGSSVSGAVQRLLIRVEILVAMFVHQAEVWTNTLYKQTLRNLVNHGKFSGFDRKVTSCPLGDIIVARFHWGRWSLFINCLYCMLVVCRGFVSLRLYAEVPSNRRA